MALGAAKLSLYVRQLYLEPSSEQGQKDALLKIQSFLTRTEGPACVRQCWGGRGGEGRDLKTDFCVLGLCSPRGTCCESFPLLLWFPGS